MSLCPPHELNELRHRCWNSMNADDGCHVQLQPLQVLIEGSIARVGDSSCWIVEVRLHDNLLLRKIHHQHVQGMSETLDAEDFDGSRCIGEDVLFPCCLENITFRPFLRRHERKPVRL